LLGKGFSYFAIGDSFLVFTPKKVISQIVLPLIGGMMRLSGIAHIRLIDFDIQADSTVMDENKISRIRN
jgi:hypothetical protein